MTRRWRKISPRKEPAPSVSRESQFRREESPFQPRRPTVGKKTIPIVHLDNAQDDQEVQELVGGGQVAHETDELVALDRRPRQPGDGIILMSTQRVVKNHQPAQLRPVKADVNESEEDEGGKANLGSPLFVPPDVLDDPEYGQPLDPLDRCYSPPCPPAPAKAPAVARRRPSCPPGQVAKAQPVSYCKTSTPQEGVSSETQESRPQLQAATARGSTLEAALISCTSEKTVTLALSLPVSEAPSQTNAQSEDLPSCTVGSEDFSATNEPVNELPDPSFPQTQCVPDTSTVPRASASRDKEAQLQYTDFFS